MKQHGFTLLEIILATALAAMISVALIFMTQQMSGTLIRVDRISDLSIRASMLQNQMERDITGAFAPTDFSATETTGEAKKDRPKKIEKIFWGDNTLEMLTFITNNPLQAYWGERSGKAQPKIVRVVYRLVPDTKHANAFTLMRQEGSDLHFDSYTADSSAIKSYAMIEGIQNIKLRYTTLIKKEEPKQAPAQATPAGKTEEKNESSSVKTTQPSPTAMAGRQADKEKAEEEFDRKTEKEWKNNIDDQKPPWPLIPQFVTMQVTLWDDTFKRTTPFTFEFHIVPRFEKADQKEKEEQKAPGFGVGSLLGIR